MWIFVAYYKWFVDCKEYMNTSKPCVRAHRSGRTPQVRSASVKTIVQDSRDEVRERYLYSCCYTLKKMLQENVVESTSNLKLLFPECDMPKKQIPDVYSLFKIQTS